MTQEEFDALEDDCPAAPPPPGRKAMLLSKLRSTAGQNQIRVAAIGLVVLAAAGVFFAPIDAAAPKEGTRPAHPQIGLALSSEPVQLAAPSRMAIPRDAPSPAPLSTHAPHRSLLSPEREAHGASLPMAVSCAMDVEAEPIAGALVSLDVSAPCDPGSRIEISQGDLRVTLVFDGNGGAVMAMPALSANPVLDLVIAGHPPVRITRAVPDVADYTRAIVHWQGEAGLELHAFEDGADYDAAGHVGPGRPQSIVRMLTGQGGYLDHLGSPGARDAFQALVYTAPSNLAVDYSIEAPVLSGNCGKSVEAATMRTAPGGAILTSEIELTMPGCEAAGDYVLLGDIAAELAVAAN